MKVVRIVYPLCTVQALRSIPIRESFVQQALAIRENGIQEFQTPVGRADVLTAREIIEVKSFRAWKAGVGQVAAYAHWYPDKTPRLHLFACSSEAHKAHNLLPFAHSVCLAMNIRLTYEIIYRGDV